MKRSLTLVLVGAVTALILVFAVRAWLNKKPEYRFGTDRAAVITQVRSLNRLETAAFSLDKVIEAGTDYNRLSQLLFGDKILLVAHGDVVAGFDLSKMKPEDFAGTGSTVAINLPAPEIFSVVIDNSQTRVFDRKQGLLTKGELNLEAEARQQAESAIRAAACEGKILDEAAANARKQLEVIFKSSGFNNVSVVIPSASC